MMKFAIFVILSLATVALAQPLVIEEIVQVQNQVIRYESVQTENGHRFVYELADGQFREEEIFILNRGTDEEEIKVTGSYSYFGDDGQWYLTKYTADRNGYVANTSQIPASLKTSNATPQIPGANSNKL